MAVSYAPKPKKKPKSEATVQVGNILRNAAHPTRAAQPAPVGFDLRRGFIRPQSFGRTNYPDMPAIEKPPMLEMPMRLSDSHPELAAIYGNEATTPFKAGWELAGQSAGGPSQADFARVNAAGEAAKAQAALDALYSQGVQPTEFQPMQLPGIGNREIPEFPNRAMPREDLAGGILGAIAGLIDKPGAGYYNAAPLQAGMQVADQQTADDRDRFKYAVQVANQQYDDRAAERGEQFKAALYNQGREDSLRGENREVERHRAGLLSAAAAANAEVAGYGPLGQQAQMAQAAGARGKFLGDTLDYELRRSSIANTAADKNYDNTVAYQMRPYEHSVNEAQFKERQRDNEFNVLGAALRAMQQQQMSPYDIRLKESQIGVNNARRKSLLDGKGENGESPMRMFELAARIAGMGGDPTQMIPGMPQNPAWGNLGQTVAGMKATALQLRDPRIRATQKAVDQAVSNRNSLVQTYQPLISQGKLEQDGIKSYVEMLNKANADIINANAKQQEALSVLSTPPTTPGSTVLPNKSKANPAPPRFRQSPPPASVNRTPKAATPTSASVSGGKVVRKSTPAPTTAKKVRRVYDPATGQFR
jgi:hypothetical protein